MYTIAFDADDTLWDNEIFFRESEKKICNLLNEYSSEEEIMSVFFDIEIKNIGIYGFGVKNLILSAIETAGKLTNDSVPYHKIKQIIQIGREQLNKPVTLIPNVLETLEALNSRNYPAQIIIATKGDLLDQERKIDLSGLRDLFHYSFIMSDKQTLNYQQVLDKLNCMPENFIMIGNSLKSDALPVLQLGSKAIHVPYKTTWQHEVIDPEELTPYKYNLYTVNDITGILPVIDQIISNKHL